jgi:hypothetical protein
MHTAAVIPPEPAANAQFRVETRTDPQTSRKLTRPENAISKRNFSQSPIRDSFSLPRIRLARPWKGSI